MKVASQYNDWNQSEERISVNGYGGCGYYRIVQTSRLLGFTTHGREQSLLPAEKFYGELFEKYDILWLHHICGFNLAKTIIIEAHSRGKKVVVDLDDNLFEMPSDHTAYEIYKHGGKGRTGLAVFLTVVDAITVSNEHLKNEISKYLKEVHNIEKPIFVIKNRIDPSMWVEEPVKRRVIGYTGSTSHLQDLKMILPAIKKVMQNDSNVRFEMLGILTKDNARKLFKGWDNNLLNRIAMLGGSATYDEYPDLLAEQGWKVGIAPLIKDEFNRARSNIKWQEYTGSGTVTIATDFTPYKETNAIKCNTEEDWVREITYWLDADTTEYLKEARNILEKDYKYSKEYVENIWNDIFATLK